MEETILVAAPLVVNERASRWTWRYNVSMPQSTSCCVCSVSEDMKLLRKCPICFQYVCEECSYRFGGRHFCSKGCADYFFFGTGEDDD